MDKLRCLIVDDEELARTLLKNYVDRVPYLSLSGSCKDPIEAIELMQKETVDLIFLDIQMPGLTGIEFLKTMIEKPMVIFTTAYSDYALEGYDLNVLDYLLKPFSFERFMQAVHKAADIWRLKRNQVSGPTSSQHSQTSSPDDKDFLLIKSEHRIHKIFHKDILYLQSMREYVSFYTSNGRILSLYSLKKLEEELPDNFLRVHKSYIIPIQRVTALEGNLLHLGETKIPIGASYKEKVMKRVFPGKA